MRPQPARGDSTPATGRYCVIRHEPASQPSCRPRASAAGRAGGGGARRRRRAARHRGSPGSRCVVRTPSPGTCSPPCAGPPRTGVHYVGDAVSRGAVAVLTDAAGAAAIGTNVGVPVRDPSRSAFGAGRARRDRLRPAVEELRVIGVTGTSGKTTTTYLAEAGLRSADRVAGLIGTVGVRIDGRDQPSALTTPEAPDLQALLAVMVEQGVDTVVMEVSSHALSLSRVDGVHFAVGGFTNLSQGPSGLPSDDAGLLRRQGAAVRPSIINARRRFRHLCRRRCGPRHGRRVASPGVRQCDRPRCRLARRGHPHGRRSLRRSSSRSTRQACTTR